MPRFPGFSCNSHGCRRNTSVEHGRTCDALGPPPAIATCIAGAARSFGTPLVQGHLRRNLVEALGWSDGSRLFLLLKTLDSNKFVKQTQPRAIVFKQHVGEATVDGLSGDVKRLDAKLDLLLARLHQLLGPSDSVISK